MRNLIRIGLLLLALLPVLSFAGPMQAFEFDDPEQEEVFKRLSHEIRCLVCQNQAIADSNADLAKDLREEIYKMLKQGKSETEITDFLVQRYGDFVLYDPPMKLSTLLLWFGPLAIFIGALFFAAGFIRTHRADDTGKADIEDDELRRLQELQQEARRELEPDKDS